MDTLTAKLEELNQQADDLLSWIENDPDLYPTDLMAGDWHPAIGIRAALQDHVGWVLAELQDEGLFGNVPEDVITQVTDKLYMEWEIGNERD